MAKICNAHPKTSSGNYDKVISNKELANLVTRVQSTTISLGTDLEKKVVEASNRTGSDMNSFVDAFMEGNIVPGKYLFTKTEAKKSKYSLNKKEPDFVVFDIESIAKRKCYIIEMKAGDNFDTKKSLQEYNQLKEYTEYFGIRVGCITKFMICCFNQTSKENIIKGLKNTFKEDEVLTGKEFCDLLEIDYQQILINIEKDAIENTEWLINKITEIESVQKEMKKKFNSVVEEKEFYPIE